MSDYIVVCIDDEESTLEYYRELLSDIDHKLETFLNPAEAIDFIDKNQKKVIMIFSDFRMPDMTGFDVRGELLERGIDHPFAIFTGFYNTEMATEAMRLKICEFIQKPASQDELVHVLNKYSQERLTAIQEEKEMISDFLAETTPMLEEIEEIILSLEENPEDNKAINTYFRLLHTIKGTASCLGLESLAKFAHKYEDLINKVKGKELPVNDAVAEAFLNGYDYLKQMYECEENQEVFPHDLDEIVKIFEGDFKDGSSAGPEIKQAESTSEEKTETAAQGNSPAAKEEKIGVSVDLLTDFMELSGEITVLKNTIFKSLIKMTSKYPGDHDLEQLSSSMSEMHKVSSLLQNQISEMKKISMDSVFKPMKRVVRDSAKTCQKKINFTMEGGQLRVDTSVGKLFNNVLVHMLRNSVDHGVESPEHRIQVGKEEEGNIHLKCYETGEYIYAEITDDGNGIDTEKLKKKVLENGLYTEEELSTMSKNRIFQFLFESGLSTAEKVTAVSGRGVGMDMVKSSIEAAGGKIYIDSELGKGTKFVLMIPIPRSILIINSLMTETMGKNFSIPLDDVAEVVRYEGMKEEDILHEVEGQVLLRHHGVIIPLVDLRDVIDGEERADKESFNIVIVKGDGYKYGIIVDEIQDIEEIVVKKMSYPLSESKVFLGATFIGDGEIGLILDLKGIANELDIHCENEEEDFDALSMHTSEAVQEYMQFDLVDHENYCIPLDYVYRLEVIEPHEVEFSGDQPLLKYRGQAMPLVILENKLDLADITFEDFSQDRNQIDVIVVNKDGKNVGLLIHDIQEIGATVNQLDETIKDSDNLLGTIFLKDHIFSVIDIEKVLGDNGSNSFSHGHKDTEDSEEFEEIQEDENYQEAS